MRYGYVDEFTSRRIEFDYCEYWVRDVDGNPNELIHVNRKKTGHFYARQENAESLGNNVIGGVFMFDTRNVTISTQDDINDIKQNDIVKWRDNVYMVADVQRIPLKKNYQFHNDIRYKTYLSLRG